MPPKTRSILEESVGLFGSEIVGASASPTASNFAAIAFVTAGTLTALTDVKMDGTYTGVTFPAGFVLYGDITTFTTGAGTTVVAYKQAPNSR